MTAPAQYATTPGSPVAPDTQPGATGTGLTLVPDDLYDADRAAARAVGVAPEMRRMPPPPPMSFGPGRALGYGGAFSDDDGGVVICGIGAELCGVVCFDPARLLWVNAAALVVWIVGSLAAREAEKRIPSGRLPWAHQ